MRFKAFKALGSENKPFRPRDIHMADPPGVGWESQAAASRAKLHFGGTYHSTECKQTSGDLTLSSYRIAQLVISISIFARKPSIPYLLHCDI